MPLKISPRFAPTILAAYVYVSMEWLFFITKPSFMDFASVAKKISIFFQTSFVLAFAAGLLWAACELIDFAAGKIGRFSFRFSLIPASVAAACLGFILFDNFTYTVFEFGIISSQGLTRLPYVALLLFLLFYFYREFSRAAKKARAPYTKFAFALLGLSLVFIAADKIQAKATAGEEVFSLGGEVRKPNIIILGTDGLDASHMSLYGYGRKTTPVIDGMAEESLVAENHFSNSCCTVGSTGSTLTGKLPIVTRFLTYPDILQGADSYQHLVRILNEQGYYAAQIGDSHQVNGAQWNMRDGFDYINGAENIEESFIPIAGEDANYFALEIAERLQERLLHAFYIKDMPKPITDVALEVVPDAQKIREAARLIRRADVPLFIHIHLLDTHGGTFKVKKQIFSIGQENKDWNPDFMDDTILQYDQYAGQILEVLRKAGKLDDTILIVYTDHGSRWRTDVRIPLVVRFPRGEYAGRIQANTQNLDIAPTLLDYMNIPQPAWMTGESLLSPSLEKNRLIFSFLKVPDDEPRANPPFFQFSAIRAVDCQNWRLLDLRSGVWTSGEAEGHTAKCAPEELRSAEEIQREMFEALQTNGYDISTLLSK